VIQQFKTKEPTTQFTLKFKGSMQEIWRLTYSLNVTVVCPEI